MKIIHESGKIFAFSFMYKNPTQNVTYDKPNFKDRKIFLKDNESVSKSEYLSDRKKLIRMIDSNY